MDRYGVKTLFVLKDLTGIRGAAERVRRRDCYTSVSWAFSHLRQVIEYRAALPQARTVAVDAHYTSQTCPQCGHVARGNRDTGRHRFACQQCHYRSHDDRIGAMNLHRQGIECRVTGDRGKPVIVRVLSTPYDATPSEGRRRLWLSPVLPGSRKPRP